MRGARTHSAEITRERPESRHRATGHRDMRTCQGLECLAQRDRSTRGECLVPFPCRQVACRNRNGGANQPLSEHALANAIDISDFVLASGKQIAVVESWPKGPANPPVPLPNPSRVSSETFKEQRVSISLDDRERNFLEFVHDEACKTFGTVLGPNADEAHKNHFHVDMKQRRGASFCQ